jgi:hypothetical protein
LGFLARFGRRWRLRLAWAALVLPAGWLVTAVTTFALRTFGISSFTVTLAIAMLGLLLRRLGRPLKLPKRLAQRFDFPLVRVLLNLQVIEHFPDLFHVQQYVVELLDDAEHFHGSLLQ